MPVLHIAEERGECPTVLRHAIASSSVTFHHVIPLLERTHRCIAIDLLGFGESPAPEWADYTLADHVAAIERTVASLRLREPFTVVGHSMGALIGARYAAQRRKQVAKLVMVSPPIYLAPHEIGDVIERGRMDFSTCGSTSISARTGSSPSGMLRWYSDCCPSPKLSISLNATGRR